MMNLGDKVRIREGNPNAGHEFYVTAKGTSDDGLTLLYGSEHGPVLAVDCETVSTMECDR